MTPSGRSEGVLGVDPLDDLSVTSSEEVQLEDFGFLLELKIFDLSEGINSDSPSTNPWNESTSRIISLIGIKALQQ